MRLNKDGTPDKRFKDNKDEEPELIEFDEIEAVDDEYEYEVEDDANELLNDFLKEYGLKLDFDVVEGTIETKQGILKLEKPTLVIKASYI